VDISSALDQVAIEDTQETGIVVAAVKKDVSHIRGEV
jgi:hypothetical protein